MTYIKIYEQMPVKQTKVYDQVADVRLYTDDEIFVECKLGQSIFYLYFIIMHGLKVIFKSVPPE